MDDSISQNNISKVLGHHENDSQVQNSIIEVLNRYPGTKIKTNQKGSKILGIYHFKNIAQSHPYGSTQRIRRSIYHSPVRLR